MDQKAHAAALAERIRERLSERRRSDAAAGARAQPIEGAVGELVEAEAAVLSKVRREQLTELVLRETVGLGPLEELLDDPRVEEVMVNGPGSVFVERSGRIEATDVHFESEARLREAIERILAPTGRRVDELSPMADARLADGSRVNVIVPPLAIDGSAVSIRRFSASRPGPTEMLESGSLDAKALGLLEDAVRGRRSVLVTGGTGSGKTTMLNALSEWIDPADRVVTIEDAAELRLRQPHVVRLESRPASIEGRGEVTIRDLLRNALRMRPDRIVIGEVRGAEALDLVSALNTGHEGALSTLHANSPEDALRRLETLALMAGVGLPHSAVREQVIRGIELIAHLRRDGEGRRHVAEIAEVVGLGGRQRGALDLEIGVNLASLPAVAGAVAGGLGALAVKEAAVATPAIAGWIEATVEPARRARREGYLPSPPEVRRLALVGACGLLVLGWWFVGLVPALSLALAGPAGVSWAIGARHARYGREVESGIPAAAIAIADSMAGGRSVRAALASGARSLEGPIGVEMARVAADLELGVSVERALAGMRERVRSARVDSLAAVLVSQRLAGGDLIGLLRRSAQAGAERERMLSDARSATAQARFTGILVVAMPAGAGLFAELLSPGFVSGLFATGVATALLLAAGALQAIAFFAIRRLSRVGGS